MFFSVGCIFGKWFVGCLLGVFRDYFGGREGKEGGVGLLCSFNRVVSWFFGEFWSWEGFVELYRDKRRGNRMRVVLGGGISLGKAVFFS